MWFVILYDMRYPFDRLINKNKIFIFLECSRLYSTYADIMQPKIPYFSIRCDEIGSYDILQCIDDVCICVDKFSGDITSSSFNKTIGIKQMPCCKFHL